ncbi:hypothetical protein [Bacillus sp. T3]|uniref:hypothetical protein n=1 Tax=Bacillus sp. T3 TaxID=467262 RepID=UPI00298267A2|nr:hypothetical protein [Bacillus sp. T3]
MNNNKVIAENKRPIIALAHALSQLDRKTNQIKLCHNLTTIVKNTKKTKLTNATMKSAMKIIEKYSL